jgi:LmbE family N-acetylglucosaminyl deacetylase
MRGGLDKRSRKLKGAAGAVGSAALIALSPGSLLGQQKAPVEGNPFQQWSEKTIMIVSPHPDDDIIGCGGALAFLSGRGNRVIVVFLTDGEKGTFDPAMNAVSLARIRRQEAARAYQSLGFADARLIWLGYHDGELDFASPRELRVKLTHLIRRHRPDVVFALDPGFTYYRYHYRDHRTAALAVADAIGAAMWPLHFPEPGVSAFRVPDVFYFYTAEPNLKLDISGVYERKLQALAQHRSQFPPANQHYSAQGPLPSRTDLETLIVPLTGATTTELFRHR